mgnify:CR=1 FL=1
MTSAGDDSKIVPSGTLAAKLDELICPPSSSDTMSTVVVVVDSDVGAARCGSPPRLQRRRWRLGRGELARGSSGENSAPVKGPTALSFGADAAETIEHVSRKGSEIWLSPSPSTQFNDGWRSVRRNISMARRTTMSPARPGWTTCSTTRHSAHRHRCGG